MSPRFAGKVVVITGAASGIGRATALRFGAEGATVVLVDLAAERLGGVHTEIVEAGGTATKMMADVSDEHLMQSTFAQILATHGRIDVLHNNAAAMDLDGVDGDIADLDVELWNRKMAVNLRGVMLGCKYAVPTMRAARSGAIINTASVSGLTGTDSNAAYGSSKAAVINLTRTVASMVGSDGIRCNAVAPGLTLTDGVRSSMSQDQLDVYAAERLLPWAASPEDIAATVTWLASDDARAITGQTIVVDCGTTAHRPRHAIAQWERMRGAAT